MLFANLPEDILWDIITTYFERDPQTLSFLATLSKRLHRITTPVLYSHVALALDDADESRKVRRFIMSVHSKPYLAQCVRSLELNAIFWIPHQSLLQRRKELAARIMAGNILVRPDTDMFKLVTLIRRLPLRNRHKHKWCTELQEVAPSLDSLVAVLLVFLPSLEKLESNWSLDPVFIRQLLPQADIKKVESSPSYFVLKSLLHLKVNSQSPCGDSSEILPFFQMPSLTHFFGSNWGPIKRAGWDTGVDTEGGKRTIASSIKHLELRYCNIDLYTLQTIVKHCKSVRTFVFHRDWDPRVTVKLSGVSITKALRPLQETLENFTLSFEPGIYIHQEAEIHPLDFSPFSALANLYVAAGYLIHDPEEFDRYEFLSPYNMENKDADSIHLHNRLPASLEVLRITDSSTPQQMQFLIDDCCRMLQHRSQVPRLRELAIEASLDGPNAIFDTSALQQEARRADVLFRTIDKKSHSLDGHEILTTAGYDWGMNGEYRWKTQLF